MKTKTTALLFALAALTLLRASPGAAQSPAAVPPAVEPAGLILGRAVMCEDLRERVPLNPGLAFSVRSGKVLCFSAFDAVPRQTSIVHNWFFRDILSTKKTLSLRPPRWSVYSSILLREADRGPWRVEILDADGRLLRTLRFSITD